jgi:hypothetical protein
MKNFEFKLLLGSTFPRIITTRISQACAAIRSVSSQKKSCGQPNKNMLLPIAISGLTQKEHSNIQKRNNHCLEPIKLKPAIAI